MGAINCWRPRAKVRSDCADFLVLIEFADDSADDEPATTFAPRQAMPLVQVKISTLLVTICAANVYASHLPRPGGQMREMLFDN